MAAGLPCNAPAAFAAQMEKEPTGPVSGSIEVEQKFIYRPGAEETLAALGATVVGSISFRDRYYDAPDWRLTLADHWLREREGAGWELKCPPQPLEGAGGSGYATSPVVASPDHLHPQLALEPLEGVGRPGPATLYQEVTCPRAIVAKVCGLLGVDVAAGWHDNVAKAIERLGLAEFASFVTCRRKYRLGSLSVDLDEADFGYAVGEVEAVVGQQEDVAEALERIRKLGCQLGFDEKTRIPGKMSVYLHKFRPAHYRALVQAGKLREVGGTMEAPGGKD